MAEAAAAWEVQFTQRFYDDLRRVPASEAKRCLEKLSFLRRDPYEKNNNIKLLTKPSHAFRLRIGDLRLIYRIVKGTREILLLHLGERQAVYQDKLGEQPASGALEELIDSLDGSGSRRQDAARSVRSDNGAQGKAPVAGVTESVGDTDSASAELIHPEELDLIGIPVAFHQQLCGAADLSSIERLDLPPGIRDRVIDYVTSPAQHHVGRIYRLDPQMEMGSIASSSLADFMLVPDSQQHEVIDRRLDGGPYLVRGGPGTGKTLIALYRLKSLYETRATESLWDEGSAYFAFCTFNRTLASTAHSAIRRLLGDKEALPVRVSTLDQIVYRLAVKFGADPGREVATEEQLDEAIDAAIARLCSVFPASSGSDVMRIVETLGKQYLLDEFELVINGNGLDSSAAYADFERKGRRSALGRRQREAIWLLHERFNAALHAQGLTTWEGRRLTVLRKLDANAMPTMPRPAHALFIDEAQDLSPTFIRLLLHLVRDPRFLMLLGDTGQSIYRQNPPWSSISPKLRFTRGTSFTLPKSYRMTREIEAALRPLRTDPDDSSDRIGVTEAVFSGPKPRWVKEHWQEHGARAAAVVADWVGRGINPGKIAVIVRLKRQTKWMLESLEGEGMAANVVYKDEGFVLDAAHVHVVNAHSAKGLEFPFVVVPFVGDGVYPLARAMGQYKNEPERQEALEKERRLLYVALSRAAHELCMITDAEEPSPLLEQLDAEKWEQS